MRRQENIRRGESLLLLDLSRSSAVDTHIVLGTPGQVTTILLWIG